jgi:hypothetical protein
MRQTLDLKKLTFKQYFLGAIGLLTGIATYQFINGVYAGILMEITK